MLVLFYTRKHLKDKSNIDVIIVVLLLKDKVMTLIDKVMSLNASLFGFRCLFVYTISW